MTNQKTKTPLIIVVIFFLLGVGLAWIGYSLRIERDRYFNFIPTPCVIVYSDVEKVIYNETKDASRTKQEYYYLPKVHYQFKFDNMTYEASLVSNSFVQSVEPTWAKTVCKAYPINSRHTCYVDPSGITTEEIMRRGKDEFVSIVTRPAILDCFGDGALK